MKYWNLIFIFFFAIQLTAIAKTTLIHEDEVVDESLTTLNEQAEENPKNFIESKLALIFNQEKAKLYSLMSREKLSYAELFIVSYISFRFSKKIDNIIRVKKDQHKTWFQTLEFYGIIRGNREYSKFLNTCDDIHPKPWKSIKKRKVNQY